MLDLLARLRQKCAIGFVGGSDLAKQQEQLGGNDDDVKTMFDWCFAENGLTAYKAGAALPSNSFIRWIGEDQYKELVRFVLHYVADLDIPIKRGTFIEFRNGMINVSPIGRNASNDERRDYEIFDKEHGIREAFVEKLRERFGHLGLTCVFFFFVPCFLPSSTCYILDARSYMINVILLSPLQLLHRRTNLVRRVPHRLGQDVLPAAP